LLGRRSGLGGWLYETFGLSLVFSWQGAVVAASVVSLPLIYKSAKAALETVDKKYEDAARTLGLSEGAVFFRVTFPLAWRGILAGAMLGFARAMGEFGATLMVAGNLPGKTQTLSMAVYSAVEAGRYSTGLFLVVITSAVCLVVLVGSGRLLHGAVER
ncbi:MAG: molybdenum ABC transporter permease, partial [bacterium]|nr:molybdenum ABC transporter permease [bacterium]